MSSKILFMGTPEFSVPILRNLNLNYEIVSIFTQPPKKKYRGYKLLKSPVHLEGEKLNIPVRFPDKLDNEKELDFLKNTEAKYVIVVAYGKLIPDKFLKIKNLLFLNIHASLLPRWRGAAPIQRSILEMDKETGISIMKITSKLDAGPVMLQENLIINSEDNFQSLSIKLSNLGSKLIFNALNLLEKKEAFFKEQDENLASYAKKISKTESEIFWSEKAKKIIAKINGLNPSPGVWFRHKGNRVKIIRADLVNIKGPAGKVLSDDLIIGCKDKAIRIKKIQKEGKKILDTIDFLKGYKINKGEMLL